MAYTVTIEQGEALDGSRTEPTFHISEGAHFHRGLVDEESDYYEDEFGNYHHKYSDLDEDRVHQIEDAAYYGTDADDQEQEPVVTDNDSEYLMDLVGGADQYRSMLGWAAQNLTAEQIQEYDAVMDSGSIADMEEAIGWLQEQYANADYVPESSSEIQEVVYSTYPDYDEMTAWADSNLSQEDIDNYNFMMENGSPQEIAEYVDRLAELYYNA